MYWWVLQPGASMAGRVLWAYTVDYKIPGLSYSIEELFRRKGNERGATCDLSCQPLHWLCLWQAGREGCKWSPACGMLQTIGSASRLPSTQITIIQPQGCCNNLFRTHRKYHLFSTVITSNLCDGLINWGLSTLDKVQTTLESKVMTSFTHYAKIIAGLPQLCRDALQLYHFIPAI